MRAKDETSREGWARFAASPSTSIPAALNGSTGKTKPTERGQWYFQRYIEQPANFW